MKPNPCYDEATDGYLTHVVSERLHSTATYMIHLGIAFCFQRSHRRRRGDPRLQEELYQQEGLPLRAAHALTDPNGAYKYSWHR